MNTELSFEEYFYSRFDKANGDQALRSIIYELEKYEKYSHFNHLHLILCNQNKTEYNYQFIAGNILLNLQPKCSTSISECIYPTLSTLNLSIKSYPFYLAYEFGLSVVQEYIREINIECLTNHQIRVMETYKYWLSMYSESSYHELRQRASTPIKG
jgi:hypothetical protein